MKCVEISHEPTETECEFVPLALPSSSSDYQPPATRPTSSESNTGSLALHSKISAYVFLQ